MIVSHQKVSIHPNLPRRLTCVTTKVTELQLERRMDAAAKKLGYVVFDEHRGRPTHDETREHLLDHLAAVEEKMGKLRAETAAKVPGRAGNTFERVTARARDLACPFLLAPAQHRPPLIAVCPAVPNVGARRRRLF